MLAQKKSQSRNVLIVFAHQRHDSFNGALLRTAVDTLTSCGHDVEVSDLYAMTFDPVIRFADYKEGRMPHDLQEEMRKVQKADLLILQFPVFYTAVPAILKGWLDRVMHGLSSFALGGDRFYQQGRLKGKKAMLSFTTGLYELPPKVLDSIVVPLQNGCLQSNGIDSLPPQVALKLEFMDEKTGGEYLDDWSKRLSGIFEEPTIEMMNMIEWSQKL